MRIKQFILLITLMFMAGASSAQDSPCDNKWGTDSIETAKAVSMFNQYFQEKKYVESFPYWYYLFNNAPCFNKRITFNGPFIIKKALREDQYKDRFDGLVDTIFLCYQKRIDLFGDEAAVKALWANDLGKLRPAQRDTALKMFAESIAATGNNTSYKVPGNYVYAAVKQHKKEQLDLDSLIQILDNVSGIIDYNIAAGGKYLEKWNKTQESVTKLMLPYLDCDKITELKQPQFEANKDNITYLKSTLNLLNKGGCEKTDFYYELSEQLYLLEPNATAALSLAKAAKTRGEVSKALGYYGEAATGLEGDQLYSTYIQMASLSIKQGGLVEGRSFARKALEINPNSGDAYILIGDAYASSVGSCSGSKLKGREVYWAAVDKYAMARSVDSTSQERATQRINKYSAYFPDNETAFFEGITDGQSYTVGCWIGETTRVRTIKN
ncbi:MAG: hypothetical protein JXR19_10380 [Bacteroidia bacterium]